MSPEITISFADKTFARLWFQRFERITPRLPQTRSCCVKDNGQIQLILVASDVRTASWWQGGGQNACRKTSFQSCLLNQNMCSLWKFLQLSKTAHQIPRSSGQWRGQADMEKRMAQFCGICLACRVQTPAAASPPCPRLDSVREKPLCGGTGSAVNWQHYWVGTIITRFIRVVERWRRTLKPADSALRCFRTLSRGVVVVQTLVGNSAQNLTTMSQETHKHTNTEKEKM